METDLMPCPVPNCGKAVRLYRIESDCHRLSCSGCDYFFDLFDADKKPGGLTVLRERHNTLARRAEIGRLVEKSCGGTLDGPLKIFPNTVGQWTVSLQSYSQGVLRVSGDTLLDALRALEAEVGGRDEPEGGPAL